MKKLMNLVMSSRKGLPEPVPKDHHQRVEPDKVLMKMMKKVGLLNFDRKKSREI